MMMNFSAQSKMQKENLATLSAFYVSSIKIFLDNRPMLGKYFTELCTSSYTEFFFLISICVENTVACVCTLLSSACTAALWHHPVSQHGFNVILHLLEGAEDTPCYNKIQRRYLKRVSGSEPSD